jgi:HSP20 family molecular chaperone IbpA
MQETDTQTLLVTTTTTTTSTVRRGYWQPAVDVYRDEEGWLCKFELSGIRSCDVEVRAAGNLLTVSGIRRDRTASADQRAWSMEILYHRFERTVRLPCNFGECTFACRHEDGMFLVAVMPANRGRA